MPVTLTSSLAIGVNSMQTTQTALSTVAHNIANVNTDGFVRQEVITEGVSLGGFGAGVQIQTIRRTVDNLLQARITDQKSNVAYNKTTSNNMNDLEIMFGQPGASSSLEKVINNMFSELNTLANSPNTTSLKLNSVNTARFVVDSIRAITDELSAAQIRSDLIINDKITETNEALANIAALNNEIISIGIGQAGGVNANDLIDRRTREINIVANNIPVNIGTDELGRVRLTSENGRRLVDSNSVLLERIPAVAPAVFQGIATRPLLSDGSPGPATLTMSTENLSSGNIKGLVDFRDTRIPNLQAEVDELAARLITEFNLVHSQGSAVPPQNTLESGNGYMLSGAGADITLATEMGVTPGGVFDISVVDIATGQPISTTLAAGGGTVSVTIPPGPLTLAGVAALINANPDVSADLTASTFVDPEGNSQLRITANNAANAIVLRNATGNPLGELGINNFFTGSDGTDIAIREDILADPSLIATARMRESDGGISFNDSRNIIELAQFADKAVAFNAAGTLGLRTETIAEYYVSITSSLAVDLKSNGDRLEFSENVLADMVDRNSSVSGVNMDEELSKLIILQNSYQASAKVISTIDEMLNILLNVI